jgi:hypothetical protein
MAIYREGGLIGTPHHKRFKRLLPILIGVVVFLVGLFALYSWIKLDTPDPVPVISKAVNEGAYTPNRLFETDWFSFEAPKDWIYVDSLSTPPTKFVYKDYLGDKATGLLSVYVNSAPTSDESSFTNIVSSSVRAQTALEAIKTSEHCKSAVPDKNNRSPQIVTVDQVTFSCYTDGVNFYAAAGAVDGTPTIKMLRDDLTEATYMITYRNIGYDANPQALQRVVSTFLSR